MMNGSIQEKIEMLEALAEIEAAGYIGLPTGLLRHAILNAIPIRELINFYLIEGSHLKSVQDNICNRLETDSEDIFDQIFESLKESNYIKRQRLRPILESILPTIDNVRQMELIGYFIRSKYVYEQNSALKLADRIWNEDVNQLIADLYQQKEEHKILAVLIKHVDDQEALELIRKHWKGSIPKYLVVKLMERLKNRTLEEIDFLRQIDPANYLALLRFAKSIPNDDILIECYQNVPLYSRPFTIWVLGKLNKWNIIEADIKAFLSAPQTTFPKFSQQQFEGYS